MEDKTFQDKVKLSIQRKLGIEKESKPEEDEEPLSMTMLEKNFFLNSVLGAITLYVSYEFILAKKSDREDQVWSTNDILKVLNEDPATRSVY